MPDAKEPQYNERIFYGPLLWRSSLVVYWRWGEDTREHSFSDAILELIPFRD